jgi:DNA-directed RNA polymerase sigma subunit (sigma70/sigma32)
VSADDTGLDAIAAQVRSLPPLPLDEVQRLLADVRRRGGGAAQERLVEHHLSRPLREALHRGNRGVDVVDLYQEGTVATIIAISEYAQRSDAAGGLNAFITKLVGLHLEHAIEQHELEKQEEEAFVRDARLYETAEVSMRHKLGRAATESELAAVLEWPAERVAVMAEQLSRARELYDSDVVQYLDDDDDGELDVSVRR